MTFDLLPVPFLWFSPGTPVSSTNKTDCHDITDILLYVALSTINLTPIPFSVNFFFTEGETGIDHAQDDG
jgi:hypothetical protein